MLEADKAEWLSVKREGAGMFELTVGEWLLFRKKNLVSDQKTNTRKHESLFDGIATTDEVCLVDLRVQD